MAKLAIFMVSELAKKIGGNIIEIFAYICFQIVKILNEDQRFSLKTIISIAEN